jgi:peptidyl-prolyl cis-trans isomerase A (cyclophilin A)
VHRRSHEPRGSRRAVNTLAFALALATLLSACRTEADEHAVPADSVLLNPEDPAFMGSSPETFQARFETSRGDFVIEVVSEWAPIGADRFYNLVRNGFYDGARFFRAIDGFMVQFGLHADPAVTDAWQDERILDDPVVQSNRRGYVTFAMTAESDSRTTQLFINLVDNETLDGMGFAPFGRVVDGMDVVDQLHTGYGDGPPRGRGPDQERIRREGNAYLVREFPQLDYIQRATIVEGSRAPND